MDIMAMTQRKPSVTSSSDDGLGTIDLSLQIPPEIWELVFDHVAHPLGLHSCMHTCTTWENILCEQRTKFLFPLIFPVLSPQLSSVDRLNCRKVCKQWKASVDKFAQKDRDWDPYFVFGSSFSTTRPNLYGTTFFSTKSIDRFSRDMEGHKGNPFPNRAIVFAPIEAQDAELPRIETHFYRFLELLEKFGDHIWTLYFYIFDRPLKAVQFLQAGLQHLPNLKRLVIHAAFRNHAAAQEVDEVLVADIQEWLTRNPFPTLNNFVSLEIQLIGASRCFVAKPLLEAYGDQLKSFHCNRVTIGRGIEFNPTVIFPKLEELKVWHVSELESSPLCKILLCQMPLKRLSIHFLEGAFNLVPASEVFMTIDKFADTLEDLYLPVELKHLKAFDSEGGQFSEETLKLTLPHVKRFGISYSFLKHPVLRDVLNKLSALEVLEFVNYDLRQRPAVWRVPGLKSEAKEDFRVPYGITCDEFHECVQGFWSGFQKLQKIRLVARHTYNIVFEACRK